MIPARSLTELTRVLTDTDDPVDLVTPGREDDDRDPGRAAQLPGHVEPVETGDRKSVV